jgi:FG-GAP-like repeat
LNTRYFALAAAALTLWLAPATGAQAPPSAAGATPPAALENPYGAAVPQTRPVDFAPQPPDGKWLKDKQGKLYFVDKLKKTQGAYQRIDDHTVRTVWGIPIEVVKEDDKYFYFKVYKVDPTIRSVSVNQPPTADELKKIAATYAVSTPESHRLQFVDFGKGLPRSGQWREGFVLADMNGDGHLDIVHGPPRKSLSPPVIFLGDGKGGWRRWQEAQFARFPYDYGDIAVADLNGDGHPDLVLAMHLKGFTALLGDGKGNFLTRWDKGLDFLQPGKGGDESNVFSSKTVTTVSWSGDKLPDILALGEGPRLGLTSGRPGVGAMTAGRSYGPVLYRNQGDGSWKRQDQGTGQNEVFGDSLTVGDFNGDGRTDFAIGSSVQGRRDLVYLGRADGGWDKVEIDVRPMSYVRSVVAADFDRKGRSALAVSYLSFEGAVWRTGIDVFYPQPDGKWQRRTLAVKEGREGVTAMAAGDLDGDGNLDLVALTGEGDVWVFLGDGKGFFTREAASIPNYDRCSGSRVRLADLGGDGHAEIVASWSGEYSPMNAPDVCRTEGGMTAWRPLPAAAAAIGGAPAAAPGERQP